MQLTRNRHALEHADVGAAGIPDRDDSDGRTQGAKHNTHALPYYRGGASPLYLYLEHLPVGFDVGNRFPAWQGNLFVGSLRQGGIEGTGHLQRVVFNENMEELRHESLLRELRQRIREVRLGPDGLLYLLTDEEQSALLQVEPAP